MLKVLFVPLTRSYVFDYVDDWRSIVYDSYSRAGLNLDVLVWPSIVKPSMKCFIWERKQYFAPCVIAELGKLFTEYLNEYLVVGIGYMDGYDHGLNFVFGEASPTSRVAIVFTQRLDPRYYGQEPDYNLYFNRVAKEIIHELGHLLGLNHCTRKSCVMSFSNSVYEVDAKTRFFCESCSRILSKLDV